MALIDKPLRLEDEMSNLKMKATEIRAPKPDMSEWTGGESYMDIDMDRPVTPALEGVFGRIDKEAEDRKMVAQWKAKQEAQQVQPPATTAAFMKSFVDKEFGGVDPYMRDPFKEARTRLDQNIQPIFKAALPGVKWGSKLTPDQNNHFAKIVKEGLQRYYTQQKSSIDSAKTLYDHRKGEFEGFQKEKSDREKKRQLAPGQVYEEGGYRVKPWYNKEGDLVKKTVIGKAKPKEEDEYKKNQALDDWRANYQTRLGQLKDDYGNFNPVSGLWIPSSDSAKLKEYKKKRQALIDEFERGQRDILEGKIPKRMGGASVQQRKKEEYVGGVIKGLTAGY